MILSDSFKIRLKEVIGGESNRSFAAKCDISEMTLRRYLAGENFPPLDTLEKIAQASGCSLAWLASGEGEMRRGDKPAVRDTAPEWEPTSNHLASESITDIAELCRPTSINKMDLTSPNSPFAWFHEWIDEELKGKSITEIMRFAVKIKSELDKEREG